MLDDERRLLTERLSVSDRRNQWVGWLILGGTLLTMFILMLAARMLTEAWTRGERRRSAATRPRRGAANLAQQPEPGRCRVRRRGRLRHWNAGIPALLGLQRGGLRTGTDYAVLAAWTTAGGPPLLEPEEEIRDRGNVPGDPVVIERRRSDGHLLEIRRTARPRTVSS